jgi:hypothetical protein
LGSPGCYLYAGPGVDNPAKPGRWIRNKYFRKQGAQSWIFHAKVKGENEKSYNLDLIEIGKIPIKRHIKIRADATPYNPRTMIISRSVRASKRVHQYN